MNYRYQFIGIVVVIGFVFSIGVFVVDMLKDEYKVSKDSIEVVYKLDKVVCDVFSGNVKDVCKVEVKGKEKIVKVELELKYKLFVKVSYDVSVVKVEVEYVVVKEKCDDKLGVDKDVCVKDVKVVEV